MIRSLREFKFPVDELLPNSRLQALKALLYASEPKREENCAPEQEQEKATA